MAIKFTSVAEAIQDNGLKALVHAPAGTGKTVFGATAKASTLIISAESGLLSLGQDVENLVAAGSPDFDPSFCTVVEVKTLEDLSEVFDELEPESGESAADFEPHFEWVVLDSITEIAEVVLASEKAINKDPRKAYGNLQEKMLTLLKSFRDLPKYNVLMTCKQEKKTDETSGVTMYQPMMPGTKLTQQIPYLFDEVWCLRVGTEVDEEGGKSTFHYIQGTRELQYEAKDRSGKLTDCEPPSLAMLYAKIKGKKPKKTAASAMEADGSMETATSDNADVVEEDVPSGNMASHVADMNEDDSLTQDELGELIEED